MQFASFIQTNQDPARPSGNAELSGIPVRAFFDRSNPGEAWLTIRQDMAPGAQLPPRLRTVTAVAVAGAQVPVRAVQLKCGAGALQGSLDPALVEAVAGPVAQLASEAETEAAPEAESALDPAAAPVSPAPREGGDGDGDGDSGSDRLVELSTQLAAARAERAGHVARVKDLRATILDLQDQLSAAEGELSAAKGELSAAGETASEHAERCAELRQQIRDLLDAEEV